MTTVLWIAGGYAVVGAVFAALFVTVGIGRMDPAAQHAPLGFRLIVFPGCAALWPWLLRRWVQSR